MKSFFAEQLTKGIIEEAPEDCKVGECHYLPLHAVFREDKSTSKIRIAFDASARSEGPSLNDCLCKGPQLTPLTFDILHSFRTYPAALTSGIEKVFLQISIERMERNYLRFLWYDDVFSDFPKLKRLRFARVIFGVTSSPFLLNGTIRKRIGNYIYDEAFVQKIGISFYVDNFSGGDTSFGTAIELYKKLRVRFAEGYFNLRKWRTNYANLKKLISETGQNYIKPEKIVVVL